MPSEVRKQWDRLVEKCAEVGLPAPVMTPMGLGDRISVNIRKGSEAFGYTSSADTMEEAISRALVYVWGYRNALKHIEDEPSLVESRKASVPERDTPSGMRHLAWITCCRILNSGRTYTGRDELTELARAVLATNTAASLEDYHANPKNRS